MNRTMSRFLSTVLDLPGCAVTLIMIVLGGMFVGCNQQVDEAAYRTIDEAFAIHQSQGWHLTKAPEDGKRYRVCGATESGIDPNKRSFTGRIDEGSRFVDFNVAIPDGKIVAVEGLDPLGGGPLSYAVLTKDFPAGDVKTVSVNHNLETKSRSNSRNNP